MMRYGGAGAPPGMFPRWRALVDHDHDDDVDGVDGQEQGTIVVTTGIKPSPNIGNALMSPMYGRSSELGLSNLHLRTSV